MKENEIKNNFFEMNLYNLAISEEKISSFDLNNDTIVLNLEGINFSFYDNITVYLRNIKTREVFKCSSYIQNEFLYINLSSLKSICTDYEYSILIISEISKSSTILNPKFKNNSASILDFNRCNNEYIKWYLRILENGEFRISTFVIFPDYSKNINENIPS